MEKVLHTKWGNAKKDKNGYYRITSKKEGNHTKYLHRLIWEDFYNTEVPKGYVIHHKNGNPLDNCILNLQLMRHKDHMSLHKYGENHSEETKMKMSEVQNTSGYRRVSKVKNKKLKQGYSWNYQYYEDGKKKIIRSVDIDKLKAKVKAKGLPWKKFKGGD